MLSSQAELTNRTEVVYEADTILAEAERRLALVLLGLEAAGAQPPLPPQAAAAGGPKLRKPGSHAAASGPLPSVVATAGRNGSSKLRVTSGTSSSSGTGRLGSSSGSSSRDNSSSGVAGGNVHGHLQAQQRQQKVLDEVKDLHHWAIGMKSRLAR
jgi:hypothetical protein